MYLYNYSLATMICQCILCTTLQPSNLLINLPQSLVSFSILISSSILQLETYSILMCVSMKSRVKVYNIYVYVVVVVQLCRV